MRNKTADIIKQMLSTFVVSHCHVVTNTFYGRMARLGLIQTTYLIPKHSQLIHTFLRSPLSFKVNSDNKRLDRFSRKIKQFCACLGTKNVDNRCNRIEQLKVGSF